MSQCESSKQQNSIKNSSFFVSPKAMATQCRLMSCLVQYTDVPLLKTCWSRCRSGSSCVSGHWLDNSIKRSLGRSFCPMMVWLCAFILFIFRQQEFLLRTAYAIRWGKKHRDKSPKKENAKKMEELLSCCSIFACGPIAYFIACALGLSSMKVSINMWNCFWKSHFTFSCQATVNL